MKRLLEIQQELKAPKNQFNSFGKYKYRSCEDILTALKPILKAKNLILLLDDDVIVQGERHYVQSNAKLYDVETGKLIASTTAYAREEENKKGMDGSQITGSSSSYARKYALNGLFMIDDGIDADTTNKGEQKEEKKDDKKRFNKEELERLEKNTDYLKKFKSSDDLIKDIEKLGFSISKEMKIKIADARSKVE